MARENLKALELQRDCVGISGHDQLAQRCHRCRRAGSSCRSSRLLRYTSITLSPLVALFKNLTSVKV